MTENTDRAQLRQALSTFNDFFLARRREEDANARGMDAWQSTFLSRLGSINGTAEQLSFAREQIAVFQQEVAEARQHAAAALEFREERAREIQRQENLAAHYSADSGLPPARLASKLVHDIGQIAGVSLRIADDGQGLVVDHANRLDANMVEALNRLRHEVADFLRSRHSKLFIRLVDAEPTSAKRTLRGGNA